MLKLIFRILRFVALLALGLALLFFLMMMSGVYRDLAWLVPAGLVILFVLLFLLKLVKSAKRQRQQQIETMNRVKRQGGNRGPASARPDNRLSATPVKSNPLWWLWGDGPRPQKIGNLIIGVFVVGGLVALFFSEGYVMDPGIARLSFYVSLVLTLFVIVYWRSLVRRKLWIAGEGFYRASALKKYLLMLPAAFLIFGGLIWLNIAVTLPYYFTLATGQAGTRTDVVVKGRGPRSLGCRYKLEPESVATPVFLYCISRVDYEALPEIGVPGTLYMKSSAVGSVVERIELDGYDNPS